MAKYTDYTDPESVVYNNEAIDNSIRNILLTKKGTLPGKPSFGTDLTNYLFNHLDHINKSLMIRTISESLNEFEPRISILSIILEEVPEYNRVNILISYSYVDIGLEIFNTTTVPLNV